jgi:hypothetical protein
MGQEIFACATPAFALCRASPKWRCSNSTEAAFIRGGKTGQDGCPLFCASPEAPLRFRHHAAQYTQGFTPSRRHSFRVKNIAMNNATLPAAETGERRLLCQTNPSNTGCPVEEDIELATDDTQVLDDDIPFGEPDGIGARYNCRID